MSQSTIFSHFGTESPLLVYKPVLWGVNRVPPRWASNPGPPLNRSPSVLTVITGTVVLHLKLV